MDLSEILLIIGIAASPISELRGAIPIAISIYDFRWYWAFLFAVIGNLIPVPFLLLLLNKIIPLLEKLPVLDRLVPWFLDRTRRRGKWVERYERIGIMLFVAIPLPITGAWTGSILAVLLGIKFRHSLLSIAGGVLIAGVIVTCATQLGWAVSGWLTAPR